MGVRWGGGAMTYGEFSRLGSVSSIIQANAVAHACKEKGSLHPAKYLSSLHHFLLLTSKASSRNAESKLASAFISSNEAPSTAGSQPDLHSLCSPQRETPPPVYKSVNEKWKEGEFSLEGNLSTHKAEERATVRETVGPCLSALNMPYNLHITDRGHFEGCHRRQTFCLQTSCSHRVDFCEGLGD